MRLRMLLRKLAIHIVCCLLAGSARNGTTICWQSSSNSCNILNYQTMHECRVLSEYALSNRCNTLLIPANKFDGFDRSLCVFYFRYYLVNKFAMSCAGGWRAHFALKRHVYYRNMYPFSNSNASNRSTRFVSQSPLPTTHIGEHTIFEHTLTRP